MTSVVFTASDTLLQISWIPPLNNGANIDSYKVNISVAGSFSEYPLLCDGSTSVTSLNCQISMSTVTSTLGYKIGQLFIAIISAHNEKGWS